MRLVLSMAESGEEGPVPGGDGLLSRGMRDGWRADCRRKQCGAPRLGRGPEMERWWNMHVHMHERE